MLSSQAIPMALADFLEKEIVSLEHYVKIFDYSELRATSIINPNTQDVFTRASDQSIRSLLSFFSENFFFSKQVVIRQYFSEASYNELTEKNILRIADALLFFKQEVQKVENEFFKNKEHGIFLAQLRPTSQWVIHFHYIIEQYLELLPDVNATDYGRFIKNIQNLSESSYRWIATYLPLRLSHYTTLQPPNKAYIASKENHNSVKKRRATFLEFFKKANNDPPLPLQENRSSQDSVSHEMKEILAANSIKL